MSLRTFLLLTLQREAIAEAVGNIAARATEAEHRVLFIWLNATTDQIGIFVRFKIRKTDKRRFG